jgi:hypothetical protein
VSELDIQIVPGAIAPQLEGIELDVVGVTITEQAAGDGLPLIDVKMRGPNDESYQASLSGRILIGIAAATKGINKRIHGREEP